MAEHVNPIPDGYRSVTPYLSVRGAAQAIDFYSTVFGARERFRLPGPNGLIGHAEIEIGDSLIMLADETPGMGNPSPQGLGGTAVSLALYVEDVDSVFNQAVAAGARVRTPVENQFYGDRSGTVIDPFGHIWGLMTHVEEVSPEEMQRRMEALAASGSSV